MTMEPNGKIPVTVLTGFLGSGKTTLLNRILTENHGKRIAVIENEFGEIGIDNDLVINADEEIFEMNNGCICCTVRGDLIRILGTLMKRRNQFDSILIETTGLADPGPVAQTFFVDGEMSEKFSLDAIVTVVDSKFIHLHLDGSAEAREQIAFADVILLNKADLASAAEMDALEARIRSMNSMARIRRTQHASIPMDEVLGLGGFDLSRALEIKPSFLEPEYPFEWSGVYTLPAGAHALVCEEGPDPEMAVDVARIDPADGAALDAARETAALRFSEDGVSVPPGGVLRPEGGPWRLRMDGDAPRRFELEIARDGDYILFTQHHPSEFRMRLHSNGNPLAAANEREYRPDHQHDDEVGSVGIRLDGSLHPDRLNVWIGKLLMEKGADIYRMKGILDIRGEIRRVVFQGVHMLFDCRPDREWGEGQRTSQLVFIGKNLDRDELTEGLRQCLA